MVPISVMNVNPNIAQMRKKITQAPKKVGRPAGRDFPRLMQMKVNDEFISTIDEWRRQQPDLPSRAEAIRRMVAMVVASEKPGRKK
jgi:hypothetical protein